MSDDTSDRQGCSATCNGETLTDDLGAEQTVLSLFNCAADAYRTTTPFPLPWVSPLRKKHSSQKRRPHSFCFSEITSRMLIKLTSQLCTDLDHFWRFKLPPLYDSY
ncbi:hypothetical protein CDAR_485961 [Caerostris darwini]|uniref:Uncharacterized protein n=1 Tax=Caerostris darwini TaxID=1538125 RepID=A0AAV4WMN7_9ARAC|nr:hypothetical protein CDAR_485961 [Caerostris darwini]